MIFPCLCYLALLATKITKKQYFKFYFIFFKGLMGGLSGLCCPLLCFFTCPSLSLLLCFSFFFRGRRLSHDLLSHTPMYETNMSYLFPRLKRCSIKTTGFRNCWKTLKRTDCTYGLLMIWKRKWMLECFTPVHTSPRFLYVQIMFGS